MGYTCFFLRILYLCTDIRIQKQKWSKQWQKHNFDLIIFLEILMETQTFLSMDSIIFDKFQIFFYPKAIKNVLSLNVIKRNIHIIDKAHFAKYFWTGCKNCANTCKSLNIFNFLIPLLLCTPAKLPFTILIPSPPPLTSRWPPHPKSTNNSLSYKQAAH